MLNVIEEIYFWSGIMRDHAEFQTMALSSRELAYAKRAEYFKNAFAGLRNEAEKMMMQPVNMLPATLMQRTEVLLLDFINFKRVIARKLLECGIEINFPPTFINHMINEACEFYGYLNRFKISVKIDSVIHNIHLHKVWLRDASGHAAAIAANLDPVEEMLIKEAEEFKKCFNCFYIKAVELGQLLERTCLENGTLKRLNMDVRSKMKEFIVFLAKIKDLRKKCEIMGNVNPLIADHMIREEKYYLYKMGRIDI